MSNDSVSESQMMITCQTTQNTYNVVHVELQVEIVCTVESSTQSLFGNRLYTLNNLTHGA